jgi:putative transposase
MVSNFSRLVKKHLRHLPKDDYPSLNSFLFVSTWLSFALDQSQSSMRCLFKRLNVRGIDVDISTFSKASKVRDPMVFFQLFKKIREELHVEHKPA